MATTQGIRLTQAGQSLLAKIHAGKDTLKLSAFVIGDHIWSEQEIEECTHTRLVSERLRAPVDRITTGTGNDHGRTIISGTLSNHEITDFFYVREIGLMAIDTDGEEILYAIDPVSHNAPTTVIETNTVVQEIPIRMELVAVSADRVELVVTDSRHLVTKKMLDDTVTGIYSRLASHEVEAEAAKEQIEEELAGLNSTVDAIDAKLVEATTTAYGLSRYATEEETLEGNEAKAAVTPASMAYALCQTGTFGSTARIDNIDTTEKLDNDLNNLKQAGFYFLPGQIHCLDNRPVTGRSIWLNSYNNGLGNNHALHVAHTHENNKTVGYERACLGEENWLDWVKTTCVDRTTGVQQVPSAYMLDSTTNRCVAATSANTAHTIPVRKEDGTLVASGYCATDGFIRIATDQNGYSSCIQMTVGLRENTPGSGHWLLAARGDNLNEFLIGIGGSFNEGLLLPNPHLDKETRPSWLGKPLALISDISGAYMLDTATNRCVSATSANTASTIPVRKEDGYIESTGACVTKPIFYQGTEVMSIVLGTPENSLRETAVVFGAKDAYSSNRDEISWTVANNADGSFVIHNTTMRHCGLFLFNNGARPIYFGQELAYLSDIPSASSLSLAENTTAVGSASIATALGTAVGNGAAATHRDSIAIGYNTRSHGKGTVSFGDRPVYARSYLVEADCRTRKDMAPLSLGLDFLNSLTPYEGCHCAPEGDTAARRKSAFLTAQDVRKTLKKHNANYKFYVNTACCYKKDGLNSLHLDYAGLIPVLIKSVQELTGCVNALKAGL